MNRKHVVLLLVALVAMLAVALVLDPALAAAAPDPNGKGTPTNQAGETIKSLMLGIAGPLLIGFLAIAVLGGMLQHNFGKILAAIGMGLAAGVPIFASESMSHWIKTIAGMIVGDGSGGA